MSADGGWPEWLQPVVEGARTIRASDISRFVPPEGSRARRGAVLMLFGEGPHGPDLLLTERAHDMRSHPGQVSFPGGSIDPTDASPEAAALREAEEETGVDPAGIEVFATLPELWLPPSNFAVTPVLGWWREPTPVTVVHPIGYSSPGFMIGEDKELILWGFTAGIVNKLFDHLGWTRPWDASVERQLPDYMFGLGQD